MRSFWVRRSVAVLLSVCDVLIRRSLPFFSRVVLPPPTRFRGYRIYRESWTVIGGYHSPAYPTPSAFDYELNIVGPRTTSTKNKI